MNISTTWRDDLQAAIRLGLSSLYKEPPMTAVEWADKHFYLSSESSYSEGKWQTEPFQIAMLNAMGNDLIEVVNIVKSARVGYTKMRLANTGYKIQHKKRSVICYSPTDDDAENFMKTHVETLIRDVPLLLDLAPWHGKKHRDSTLSQKRFANQKMLWSLGGKAAKNYREKSPDEVQLDELSKFDSNIQGEGAPTFLADKRLEGATFKKSIRGSTPAIEGACQISKAAGESPYDMRFYIECPHCNEEQTLKFGGKGDTFGLKWEVNDLGEPSRIWYACEKNGCVIENHEAVNAARTARWICSNTRIWTRDSIDWFDSHDTPISTPKSVTFRIWTIYSTFTTWESIVTDWLKIKGDRESLVSFVNTTLGETWEEDDGEKLDPELLYNRREHYQSDIPLLDALIVCAVDVQDDRFEIMHSAWVEGEECYVFAYKRLYGDLSKSFIWRELHKYLMTEFELIDGTKTSADISIIDSGGHYTDEVCKFSKRHGLFKYVPIRGSNQVDSHIFAFPRKKNKKGVYLTELGTQKWKWAITSRLKIQEPGERYIHYPVSDSFDLDHFKQLCSERLTMKEYQGRRRLVFDDGGRRNEAFDTIGYSLCGVRILTEHLGREMPPKDSDAVKALRIKKQKQAEAAKEKAAQEGSKFLNYQGDKWL